MEIIKDQELINYLIAHIKRYKNPAYPTYNHSEISVRCPYCGDSIKSSRSAHLYIKMSYPFLYYCQRCKTSAALDGSTLRDLDLYDKTLAVSLAAASKNYNRANKSLTRNNSIKAEIKIPDSNIMVENNLHYLNSRFNSNLTIEEAVRKYKAILDPFKYFNDNGVPRSVYVNRGFDFTKSIGFLSSDKSHIIFRDITDTQTKRYFNLKLYPNIVDKISGKQYNISSDIDVMADNVKLVITEGIFDIIGVETNVYENKNKDNIIFAAACGKGFNAVISHFIKLGFLNLEIEIYSDSDVDINFYKMLKSSLSYIKNTRLVIYYNSNGKDFGVPKDEIKIRKVIV